MTSYFVPTDRKVVAITFDDGPTPGVTDRILEVLSKNGAKGTFFMVGKRVEENQSLVREVVSSGGVVGIHGQSHRRGMKEWSYDDVYDDFKASVSALASATGELPSLARPPFGNVNKNIWWALDALGMDYVGWSLNSIDWAGNVRFGRLEKRMMPGTVVLFHDGGRVDKDKVVRTSALLEELILWGNDRGYSFVTIPELLGMWNPGVVKVVGGKRLLGVRSLPVEDGALVTPMWDSNDIVVGMSFSVSAGREPVQCTIPPLSNVDDWTPEVEVNGPGPVSVSMV